MNLFVLAAGSQDFTGVPRLVDIPRGLLGITFDFMAICDNITEDLEFVELEIVIPGQYIYRVKAISPITTRVNIIGKLLCVYACVYCYSQMHAQCI